jgi:hypothetical protein
VITRYGVQGFKLEVVNRLSQFFLIKIEYAPIALLLSHLNGAGEGGGFGTQMGLEGAILRVSGCSKNRRISCK